MKDEIILRFENEYEFDSVVEEIYYIFHDAYNKTAIEEAKEMLMQFMED
jgi:hypothetical protein